MGQAQSVVPMHSDNAAQLRTQPGDPLLLRHPTLPHEGVMVPNVREMVGIKQDRQGSVTQQLATLQSNETYKNDIRRSLFKPLQDGFDRAVTMSEDVFHYVEDGLLHGEQRVEQFLFGDDPHPVGYRN